MIKSDGGSTKYYELPDGATELNDLIEHKNMSFALGNIFKACYRFGEKDSADRLYDLNKIKFFADRLIDLEDNKIRKDQIKEIMSLNESRKATQRVYDNKWSKHNPQIEAPIYNSIGQVINKEYWKNNKVSTDD